MTSRTEVLIHPVRIRIAQAVSGRELTTRQIADELTDVPASSIYRHISLLLDAGFLKITDSRPVRGTVEKTYTLNTDRAVLEVEDMAQLTSEEHIDYFTTWVRAVLQQGTRFLANTPGDPRDRGFGYRFNPLWLTDEELVNLKSQFEVFYAKYGERGDDPNRRRHLLSTIFIPDPDPST